VNDETEKQAKLTQLPQRSKRSPLIFHHSTMFKIAEHPNELNFATNGLAEVVVNGKKICVGQVGTMSGNLEADRLSVRLFACAAACPHAGARMANGQIDALGNIICPLHRYKFSLVNGRNVSGEGYHLKTWKVEWREDGVWVELRDGKWLM
jgi:nitrite reductase/ring-hydroxylating ferredoxin subunit